MNTEKKVSFVDGPLKEIGKFVRMWQWMIGRSGIAQEILRKSTDFFRRIIAPVDGMGRVTLSHICPHCSRFLLYDYVWWVSTGHGESNSGKKKQCNWWCAACGGQYEWRAPNRVRVVQLGVNANEAKVFKAHAAPLGLCDNLINELKKDGDSPIQKHCNRPARKKKNRRGIMDGLRSFIRADNRSAVAVGHLRQGTRQLHVQNPSFSEAFPGAAIREGANELTLKA